MIGMLGKHAKVQTPAPQLEVVRRLAVDIEEV